MATLKEHLHSLVRHFPLLHRYARFAASRVRNYGVSEDYRPLMGEFIDDASVQLTDAWKDDEIPGRQRALVNGQLESYRKNIPNPVFDALVNILVTNIPDVSAMSLLEIGCSSGYYSEVLRIKGIQAKYTGCDYSPAFIHQASQYYPAIQFNVENAVSLSYPGDSFDIVVSGGCILHISDFGKAISEAARVARKYVVFHRTPVLHRNGPIYYRKKAYGVETLEIHFNEQKLVKLFARHGLAVVDVNTHALSWDSKLEDALAMKAYLCRRT